MDQVAREVDGTEQHHMSSDSGPPLDLRHGHYDAFLKLGGAPDRPVPNSVAATAIQRVVQLAEPFGLGRVEDAATETFVERMLLLADIDRDGSLNAREFQMMWQMLPLSSAESLARMDETLKMSSDARAFVFGSREDWIGGMQRRLRGCVSRSVQMECTLNAGGKYRSAFECKLLPLDRRTVHAGIILGAFARNVMMTL